MARKIISYIILCVFLLTVFCWNPIIAADTTVTDTTVTGNTALTTPSGATNVVCSVVAVIAGFTAAFFIRP